MTADLLIEILNEEIPSRMQKHAAESFESAFIKKLKDHGLGVGESSCFITPRRIALHIKGIPVQQNDRFEEKRGPRVGAPEQAIQGFLVSAGLTSLDECEKRESDKGEFWFAAKFIQGLATADVLPQILNDVIKGFTWPKSMRWGRNTVTWVRPIRSILCLFNDAPVKGHLDLGSDVIEYSASTTGHRFLSKGLLTPDNYVSYRELLSENYVMLDQHARRLKIADEIHALAAKHDLRIRTDEGLLDEVTGLVEWPVALFGRIDPAFMDLPEEVLITSMRVHQRYFALEDNAGKLAPYFILVSNVVPADGGAAIVVGNERVLRARLSDAKFFFEQDKQIHLEKHGAGLSKSIFQESLGTMADKVARMTEIAGYLAQILKLDQQQVERATSLSKSDLMSQMVGEFPELQGTMGYYYSQHNGEDMHVSQAIADHYKPKGFSDDMPRSSVGAVVSLADKIDTLVGYFSIGIKPTGSKDPYALRRSSIGCIRLLESMKGLQIDGLVAKAYEAYAPIFAQVKQPVTPLADLLVELREFFFDRLKAYWREKGVRHDYLEAVFAVSNQDAFDVIALRVEALNHFMTDDVNLGEQLLSAYRRASNIVRIEEKKDAVVFDADVNAALLTEDDEKAVYQALLDAKVKIAADRQQHNFKQAMTALSDLRPVIDVFFETVTVNDDDEALRVNRLKLLSLIRMTLHEVADFSKIEG